MNPKVAAVLVGVSAFLVLTTGQAIARSVSSDNLPKMQELDPEYVRTHFKKFEVDGMKCLAWTNSHGFTPEPLGFNCVKD